MSIAFMVEILVGGPIARFIMKKIHNRVDSKKISDVKDKNKTVA